MASEREVKVALNATEEFVSKCEVILAKLRLLAAAKNQVKVSST